jgi:hypothetical protein
MDIHKPKPWHGVREFLKEYLIIFVGVLTALGAEQGVEWLHWRHRVEVTEQRLTAEVRTNLLNAYGRLNKQRCYNDRLTRLSEQLRGNGLWRGAAIQRTPASAPETIPPYMRAGLFSSAAPAVYIASTAVWPDSTWTSALASGVTLRLGRDRADRYSRLYRGIATMRDLQTAESETASKLSALAFDRQLSEAERTHFLEAIGQLSFWNVQQAAYARGMIKSASTEGIRLQTTEVARLTADDRHYFLSKDCIESISIPLDGG